MTRADKLRSMTDGQLADLIFECGIDDLVEFCQGLPECEDGRTSAEDCKKCLLRWLRSPAEGAEEAQKVEDAEKAESQEDRESFGENALFGHCPNCGELINSVWNEKYCGDCGQAIDWDKEKGE